MRRIASSSKDIKARLSRIRTLGAYLGDNEPPAMSGRARWAVRKLPPVHPTGWTDSRRTMNEADQRTLAAHHYGGDLGCAFRGCIRTRPTKESVWR